MLLKKLFDVIIWMFDSIIPDQEMPVESLSLWAQILETLLQYVSSGIEILRMFLGSDALRILSVLFGLIISFNFIYMGYSVAMWIISKIPFLGVK